MTTLCCHSALARRAKEPGDSQCAVALQGDLRVRLPARCPKAWEEVSIPYPCDRTYRLTVSCTAAVLAAIMPPLWLSNICTIQAAPRDVPMTCGGDLDRLGADKGVCGRDIDIW